MIEEIKYRPKRFIQYYFGNWNCIISCYPQQHWVVTNLDEDNKKVRLEYKSIVINISMDDFNTNWVMKNDARIKDITKVV